MEWKSRDEQIIDFMARIEEKQGHMHEDIKKLLDCDKEFETRISSLEHTKSRACGIIALALFLVGIAKAYGLI